MKQWWRIRIRNFYGNWIVFADCEDEYEMKYYVEKIKERINTDYRVDRMEVVHFTKTSCSVSVYPTLH